MAPSSLTLTASSRHRLGGYPRLTVAPAAPLANSPALTQTLTTTTTPAFHDHDVDNDEPNAGQSRPPTSSPCTRCWPPAWSPAQRRRPWVPALPLSLWMTVFPDVAELAAVAAAAFTVAAAAALASIVLRAAGGGCLRYEGTRRAAPARHSVCRHDHWRTPWPARPRPPTRLGRRWRGCRRPRLLPRLVPAPVAASAAAPSFAALPPPPTRPAPPLSPLLLPLLLSPCCCPRFAAAACSCCCHRRCCCRCHCLFCCPFSRQPSPSQRWWPFPNFGPTCPRALGVALIQVGLASSRRCRVTVHSPPPAAASDARGGAPSLLTVPPGVGPHPRRAHDGQPVSGKTPAVNGGADTTGMWT